MKFIITLQSYTTTIQFLTNDFILYSDRNRLLELGIYDNKFNCYIHINNFNNNNIILCYLQHIIYTIHIHPFILSMCNSNWLSVNTKCYSRRLY
ncbi:hypothetical protein EST35_0460 [Pseudomonas phage vB_PaeM_PA5oct]|uniref:Uncharacterized protein n=1 Tax=Pseudomonas phage vB_PaeM_PA5oct TaxID=2163605 RepID=A0A4Y5JUH6_9CAUD|nr:hypothetical protein PQE65_gp037 [Pseudomonas phage vB_PaeM_PA5oct]QCG76328.1 hypothetical protein EST35_0460 [Pseudomonas phage vB_PaeM_PA5oct]